MEGDKKKKEKTAMPGDDKKIDTIKINIATPGPRRPRFHVSYTAILLDQPDQYELERRARELGLVLPGDKIFCHHCTLTMGRLKDEEGGRELIGTRHPVVLREARMNDTVSAVRVELPPGIARRCRNAVPHVTIATRNGGKPRDSNDGLDWGSDEGGEAVVRLYTDALDGKVAWGTVREL